MKAIEILDRDYKRLCFMDNDAEDGLHYRRDRLNTTTEGGIYVLDFEVPKDNDYVKYLADGNYITFLNNQDVRLLLTIMDIDDNSDYKKIYCEDTNIYLINKIVRPQGNLEEKRTLKSYVEEVLEGTGWTLGINESEDSLAIEFNNTETLLARLRNICQAFGVEFYFSVELEGEFDYHMNVIKRRLEGEPGFRVSTEDLLTGIERKVSIDNLATKLILEGTPQNQTSATTTVTPDTPLTNTPITEIQPTAVKYDSSKSSGATAISWTGWSESWVDNFNMNAADPPYVNGAYINAFLKRFYPDVVLNGHGETIKEMADYFGIAVGAFLGVVAKESTYGRNACGGRYNFGCIKWSRNSPFPNQNGWIDPPNVKSGIAAWFKLARYNYINTGQVKYRAFLNKYSPTNDGNAHSEFKNFMWAQLKSFGYDTSDTVTKKNYSKESDNPLTLNVSFNVGTGNTSTPTISEYDKMINKLIQWFEDRKKGKPNAPRYSMSSARSGPSYYDCSSAVYAALKYAGFKTNISWLGSTVTLWGDIGANKLMTEIPRVQARRGDIFLAGGKGAASAGANGHTGVFMDNQTIIHMNYADNGITHTPQAGRSSSPIWCFRLNDHYSKSSSGGTDTVNTMTEKAVQRALSQVGGRYVWGGVAYRANDCSGIIYEAYRYAGFVINHRCTTRTIAQQQSPFRKISAGEAKRGDLVIQHNGGHVAILLGSPNSGAGIVHAANESLGIITQKSITNVNGYYRVMPPAGGGNSSPQTNGGMFSHYPTTPANSQINHPFASPYGYASHRGIDIVYLDSRSDIYAVDSGVVEVSHSGCSIGNPNCGGGWGNHIRIKHSNGYSTLYAHLSSLNVSKGQTVTAGQVIGKMGNTGNSTGKHLHLELWEPNGNRIDPESKLDFSGYKRLFG